MFYRVTARLRTETGADFLRTLTDGTIARQRPDGQEMVDAMNRAVLTDDGTVSWSEVCYCPTPLAHERATVLDKHFDALETQAIDGYERYDGRPFVEYLAELVGTR